MNETPGETQQPAHPTVSQAIRSATLLQLIPLALAIVAEAAWISVVAGLLQEYALRGPALGIAAFSAFVAVGVLAARLLGARLGARWPLVALALMVVAGCIGWLASAEARTALTEVGLGHGLAVHPGGWLAGVAVLRGFAHARPAVVEQTLARLLSVGIPGMALAAFAGGMVAEPWRGLFLAEALVAAIAFATCATLSLAMARLTAIGAASGFDWRRNPAWVGLLVVLVAVTAALAVPVSSVAGPLISLLVGLSIGPFILIGFVIGFDRRAIRILAAFVGAALVLVAVLTLIGNAAQPAPAVGGVSAPPAAPPEPGQEIAIGAALIVLAAIVATVILAKLWMRRVAVTEGAVAETRTIDRGDGRRPGRATRRRRRSTPVDAITAYVALDEDLAGQAELRRQPAETPAEHAHRLRAGGRRELAMDLLAADYALARFAGIELSPLENRRAVARWRALRVRLRESGS
jgi:hypothetical protein